MEQYLWMIIGFGFFAKSYWEAYQAYRTYVKRVPLPKQDDLICAPPLKTASAPRMSHLGWLLKKGDHALHVMLMSPVAR